MSGRLHHPASRGGTVCALGGILFGLLLTLSVPSAAAEPLPPSEQPSLVDWFEGMERFFEANPHLKDRRGSGWKPYNRLRWAAERRMTHGRPPAPGARWDVWQVKRQRERPLVPRAGWFEIGPMHLSGRINDIEFHPTDPSIVYAGSASGGLWKSTDGGSTWATTTGELPTLGVGAVAVLPWNPDIVLLGTGEGTPNVGRVGGVGILKSTDAGSTWNPTGLSYPVAGIAGHGFHVMEANPLTGTILAGATDGLWRSTDDGESWTAVKEGGDYFDVKWKPGDALRVYCVKGRAAGGNNVKVSTDDGLTWAKAGTGQPFGWAIGKSKIAVSPDDPNVVYAYYTDSGTTLALGVYRSTDNGATWTLRNGDPWLVGGQGWYNLVLVVDPDDVDRVLAGGVYLYVSTDAGSTFVETGGGNLLGDDTHLHVDHHGIAYEPGSTTNVWIATDGGVWRSTDDGETWSSRREGLATYQFYDVCVAQTDPIFLMGGTQDNGIPGRDGTVSWFVSTLIADGMVCHIDPTNADVIYGEEQVGVHVRSTDGGQSWTETMNGIPGYGPWVTPVDEDPNAPTRLYTATNTAIYRTVDGGDLWEHVTDHPAVWISISPVDGSIVWTVHDSTGVMVTTDDGDSWTGAAAYGFPTGPVTRVCAHPTEAPTAFVTFGAYDPSVAHVARTTDLGATWTDLTGDFPSQPVNAIVIDPDDPDHWYIGTDVGVWASTSGGAAWIPFETGLPNAVVYDLEIQRSARKLVAGTHGRGAWEIALPPPNSTGAGAVVTPGPVNLMLDPPFPNPVHDGTFLRYAARSSGPVSLELHDVRGRRVYRLAEHSRGDGVIRTVPWFPGENATGVYFAVLRAGPDVRTHKIVVAR